MAALPRGWSRNASTALKLATAEKVIGYQFKNVDLLYEALDQKRERFRSPDGKRARLRTRNSRLAFVGDVQAKLYLAQQWYKKPNLSGAMWQNIESALSNEHLGQNGFSIGLDECGIPDRIENRYDIASTVEAVFAAVQMDGAGEEQVQKVMYRFGIHHKLVTPVDRAWIHEAVISKLTLPNRFFIGHQFKLQEKIFETKMTQPKVTQPSPAHRIGLWERIKRLWLRPNEKTTAIQSSLRGRRQIVSKLAAQSPASSQSVAEEPKVAANGSTTTPSKDVSNGRTEVLGEDLSGHFEEDDQAPAPDEMTERKIPAPKQEVSEGSTSGAPASSTPTKTKSRAARSKEDTSVGDIEPTEADVQAPGNNSKREKEPNQSREDSRAVGVELQGQKQLHEDSAVGPVTAKAEDVEKLAKRLKNELADLATQQRQIEERFRRLRSAGKQKSLEDMKTLRGVLAQRTVVKAKYEKIRKQLIK